MDVNLFTSILILLTLSIFVTAVCQRIKIPVIVGYIIVGIVVGSSGIELLSSSEPIKLLAEFGIVFLMFTVGLEFSLSELIKLRKDVFFFGGLQVLLTIVSTMVIGLYFGLSSAQSLVVGSIVAMSSTAIAIRQLAEQDEINSSASKHAIGILLFQDLAVIPILILLPSLKAIEMDSLVTLLGLALLKGSIAILLLIFVGKKILKPLFYHIANQSLELFTLMILFITFLCAGITQTLGLSYVLGAFLAGMLLGETEFKHQIKTDIRPFKDVLVGFFFITIGMQFNTDIILVAWNWVLLMFLALVLFKIFLITLLGFAFTESKYIAGQTGLILAQGSEFGFVILTTALAYNILPADYGQVILAALLLSMLLAPFLIKYQRKILHPLFSYSHINETIQDPLLISSNHEMENHILLCGYGRVGQNIARFLEKAQFEYIALDLDPKRVKNARLAGENIFYADATDYQNLAHAHIAKAKVVIIGFIAPHAATNIIEQIRQRNHKIPIIVRSHDDTHTNLFYEKGATEVIPENYEAALMISSHILLMMNVMPEKVHSWVEQSRHKRYDLLRMIFPGNESTIIEETSAPTEGLHVISLSDNAYAINREISELTLEQYKVKVIAIRREKQRIIDPAPSMKLQAGDIVVIYGVLTQLEEIENMFLVGND